MGCKVVFYCNSAHQTSDWGNHKRNCRAIQKTQSRLEAEEKRVPAFPPLLLPPLNHFPHPIPRGPFWTYPPGHPHILATLHFARARALLEVKTEAAVLKALDHVNEILRIDRSDELGARFLLPSIFLRLGRDQLAYDYIKWQITKRPRDGNDNDTESDGEDVGYLTVNGADVFEDIPENRERRPRKIYLVALALIKIRVLQDLKSLQGSTVIAEKVPREILNNIRRMLVGTIVAERKEIMDSDDQSELIERLEEQIGKLYDSVNTAGASFLNALLQPEVYLHRPERSEAFRHRYWAYEWRQEKWSVLKCGYDASTLR